MLAIDMGSLRLAIRAIGPTNGRSLIPGQSQPVERVEDHLLRRCDKSSAVSVFNPENKFAVALFGVKKVDQADVGGAYVWIPSRGGGDANAYWGFGCRDAISHK